MRVGVVVWMGMMAAAAGLPAAAEAQPLGSFRWQMAPYCNVVTLDVTQTASGFRVEGTDDLCGAGADKASAIGTAFQNPDGSIGMGLNLVLPDGGAPVHVEVALDGGNFHGRWSDSSGQSGRFLLTPGNGSGGAPRPQPAPVVPKAIELSHDGGFVVRSVQPAVIPTSGPGDRMMWHPGKAAFRAGTAVAHKWDEDNVGVASFAVGEGTQASGGFSAAWGRESEASGHYSTAFGYRAAATGRYSVAGGDLARATGDSSVALGRSLQATGDSSVAFGHDVQVSGDYALGAGLVARAGGSASVALGRYVSAFGDFSVALGQRVIAHGTAPGTFLFGDSSTTVNLESNTPNQFMTRFAGGYVFWSTRDASPGSPGVRLAPGASDWSTLSDVNSKEHFRELSGDDVLAKLAAMPIRTWNYKAQDASIRHVGPTAQDFHAAFGLGDDDLRISTIDADGIALAGVKALESRTRALADRAERLERENGDLRARLEQLERLFVQR